MKVLNFGSCNIDYVYKVDHIIKAGETLSASAVEIFPGGKGLNQSIAIAKAGSKVAHAGIIGEDGAFLKDTLLNAGVDVSFLKLGSGKSGHAIIQVDKNGENCICVFDGTNGHVEHEFIDSTLANFQSGDIIVLQNEISSLDYILERAYEKGMRVVLNPSPYNAKIAALDLGKVSYLILNQTEARALFDTEDRAEFIHYMRERYPSTRVILTLGVRGAVYFSSTEYKEQPAFSVNAVDTTSAGDTFTGYFVSFISSGKAVEEALKYASAASAITVSRLGASVSIPYLTEVESTLPTMKPHPNSTKSSDEILLERIKAYISEHLTDASLRELASRLGYSPAYIGSVIKRLFGTSFSSLIQGARCRAAAQMLDTGVPVGEAIRAVGYENESFFRKKFKELYGRSPGSYRRKN